MPATPVRTVRLTDAEWAQIQELGRQLGPVKPLLPADVIRELLRRSEQQTRKPKTRRQETQR